MFNSMFDELKEESTFKEPQISRVSSLKNFKEVKRLNSLLIKTDAK